MESNRALPRAIWLCLGALISVACFCALFVGIAHLMPRFLSPWTPFWSRLIPVVAVLMIAVGCFRNQRRSRRAVKR